MLTLCIAAAVVVSQASDMDAFVQKALKDYHVPGAAVVIVQDGKTVLLKGYGVRDTAKQAPVDPNTVFQMASVSKAFTGTLAGALKDEGKLDFDRPIFNYLPEFVHYDDYIGRNLTMRDLLAHRSGYPAFGGDTIGQVGFSRAEVLRRLRYYKPANSLRDRATYSNIAFFLAGEVEAAVGGGSWDELMASKIFAPLGMRRSFTTLEALQDSNTSNCYAMVDGKMIEVPHMDHNVLGAAGSVATTASDIANWLKMLLAEGRFEGRQVLKPETVKQIFERSMVSERTFAEMPPISEASGFYYGLGFGSYDYANVQVIEKGGAIPGVRTTVVLVPEKHAAIAVFANLNLTAFPEAIRAEWLARLLNQGDREANQKEIMDRNNRLEAMFKMPSPPKNPKPAPFSLDSLVGTYESEFYGTFEIRKSGDGLVVRAGTSTREGVLSHVDGGLFWLKWPSVTEGPSDTTFAIGADGRAETMINEVYGVMPRKKA